jgi:hypothetical protein
LISSICRSSSAIGFSNSSCVADATSQLPR